MLAQTQYSFSYVLAVVAVGQTTYGTTSVVTAVSASGDSFSSDSLATTSFSISVTSLALLSDTGVYWQLRIFSPMLSIIAALKPWSAIPPFKTYLWSSLAHLIDYLTTAGTSLGLVIILVKSQMHSATLALPGCKNDSPSSWPLVLLILMTSESNFNSCIASSPF